jgi:hypothetical protein
LQSITNEKTEERTGMSQHSPIYSFMYALKSSEARRQYPKRLKMLFDFIGLHGSLEEQATEFSEKHLLALKKLGYTFNDVITKCYSLLLSIQM